MFALATEDTEYAPSANTDIGTSRIRIFSVLAEGAYSVSYVAKANMTEASSAKRLRSLYVKHHLSLAVSDLVIPIRPPATLPTPLTCFGLNTWIIQDHRVCVHPIMHKGIWVPYKAEAITMSQSQNDVHCCKGEGHHTKG